MIRIVVQSFATKTAIGHTAFVSQTNSHPKLDSKDLQTDVVIFINVRKIHSVVPDTVSAKLKTKKAFVSQNQQETLKMWNEKLSDSPRIPTI